jgi:4'-phosphopantetheinyl transferase
VTASGAIDVYRIRLDGPARSGCADAALRDILAERLGVPPSIVTTERGKPHLPGGELEFNVSHSGDLALIAVSTAGPIGVDLEQHRELAGPSIARRFFTPAEAAIVDADPNALFRIWVRKEAWAKAHGEGLWLPLDRLDVSGEVDGWSVVDLDIAPGYAAAVAWRGPRAAVRVFDRAG